MIQPTTYCFACLITFKSIVCLKCKGIMEGTMDSIEKLCDEVETVNGVCYLGDRPNANGGCEVAVTARVRIGWVRFRECGELLLGNRFPLKMKGKVYCCCEDQQYCMEVKHGV